MDYLQFSLSYPFNREAENDDDTVEFLSDERVPCLICGNFKEIDNIIKQEVGESLGKIAGNAQGHNECVDVNVDDSLSHWFLKWFRIEIAKNGKQRLVDREWDGEGGDILRFCAKCKLELVEILEMQKQKERLEKNIITGLEEVKVKMERSEKIFQINGIYEIDQRYKLVRSSILKCGEANPSRDNNHRSSVRSQVDQSSSIKLSTLQTNMSDIIADGITTTTIMTGTADMSMELDPIRVVLPVTEATAFNHTDISSNVLSDIPAGAAKTPTKIAKKIIRKKVSTRKPPKKRCREEVANRTSPRIKKKIVSEKVSRLNPSQTGENPSQEKVNSRKSAELETRAVEQNKTGGCSQQKTSKDTYTEYKSNGSPKILASSSTKMVSRIVAEGFSCRKSAAKGKYQNKICRRKSPRIAKKIGQEKVHRQISPRISKKVVQTEASGLKLAKMRNNLIISPIQFKANCKDVLDSHVKSLHCGTCGPKLFLCSICSKPFAYKRNRTNHEWTHMNKNERNNILLHEPNRIPDWLRKEWSCDKCEKKFPQELKLKRHKESCHEGKARDICPQCGKAVANLRHHIKYNHMDKKRFQCPEQNCGVKFKMIGELTRHKNAVHSKVKPWKCTICSSEFAWKHSFQGHMELHQGIHSWMCKVKECGATFVTKSKLRKHHKSCHSEGGFYERMANLVGVKTDALVKKGHSCHRVLRSKRKLRI